MNKQRRAFFKTTGKYVAGMATIGVLPLTQFGCSSKAQTGNEEKSIEKESSELFFKISLAQWSLHKALFEGKLDNLDFAKKAHDDFGINAVEYVNQFFKDKAKDQDYLKEMKMRTDDLNVENVLIMIDGEGGLGISEDAKRMEAVENHYKWVEAAKFLGCHAIRVNAYGENSPEEIAAAAVDGLGKLSEFASDFDISVIVENHGGPSSNGKWLSDVISKVNMPNCGTLPDLGNFCIKREGWECIESYDRYQGAKELMLFAKGVSAKTYQFDEEGNVVETDYYKMLSIIKESGYTGYIGVEYEGRQLPEDEGIQKTIDILKKAGKAV